MPILRRGVAAFLKRFLSVLPLLAILSLALAGCSGSSPAPAPQKAAQQAEELPPPSPVPVTTPAPPPTAAPGVMPANLLIADRANNRVIEVTPDRKIVWEFPGPGDLLPGQRFRWPDDAFYAPDRKSIVINEEEAHAIVLLDYASHRIVWQYGVSERPGSARGYDHRPDDAAIGAQRDGWGADALHRRVNLID